MNDKPRVCTALAFLFGISALIIGVSLFAGCAATPPPPPVIVPVAAPTPQPIPDPYASLSSDVVEAIKHNQSPTLQHGITTVYAYSPDVAYPLNCQKLHVTQVRLRDDETTSKQDVKIGDVTRWGTIVGDHSVLVFPLGSTTSITVPGAQVTIPAEPSMITNLAIHSSAGRNYVFNPVKEVRGSKDFTQAISFYYPSDVRAQAAARDAAIKAGQQTP
jgi:type IV secretory pathway VirB9-like protein